MEIEEVWFEHPAPEQAQAHAAAFGAPVFSPPRRTRSASARRGWTGRCRRATRRASPPGRGAAPDRRRRRAARPARRGDERDPQEAARGPAGIDRVAASLGLPAGRCSAGSPSTASPIPGASTRCGRGSR
uniref:hypothetical protein n=1 Tax=Acidocella sp. C78 TaxID=1671486 RepID=UPI0035B34F28